MTVQWIIGGVYDIGGQALHLVEIVQRRRDHAYVFTTQEGDEVSFTTAALKSVMPRDVDKRAEAQARILFTQGWRGVSGKHLTIARPTGGFPLQEPDEEYLRTTDSRYVERKTIDVDTYVALKKLRRAKAAVNEFRAGNQVIADLAKQYFGSREDRLYPYQSATLDAMAKGLGVSFNSPPCAEDRYIAELNALPDSLYKRTQLRFMRLPKAARRDHEARRKTFDREARKYIVEKLKNLPAGDFTDERIADYILNLEK